MYSRRCATTINTAREVAIKLMRADVRSTLTEQRFRVERQILAGLDHRNIARLLDGGTTEGGMPYVVMELVTGQPIDAWCEARQLDVRDRVQLFLQVCAAVSYAHQHLVVHRDLKPSNILVTADGSVKLLDFGIAKLLEAEANTDIARCDRHHAARHDARLREPGAGEWRACDHGERRVFARRRALSAAHGQEPVRESAATTRRAWRKS